jgi:hypothetical protein
MDTVSLMAPKDLLLCPVIAAAAIMRQIMKYPGSSKNSPTSMVLLNGIIDQVKSSHMIDALGGAVVAIREVTLGVKREEVGTHSIRTGTAMAMYLGECPIYLSARTTIFCPPFGGKMVPIVFLRRFSSYRVHTYVCT